MALEAEEGLRDWTSAVSRALGRDSVIVALDAGAHEALAVARSVVGLVDCVKVGMTLYYAEGPGIVRRLQDMGLEVFLDLKLHDIPHQVEGAARSIGRLGVRMLTVHASGGRPMLEAAVRGALAGSVECGTQAPAVLAVTVLTSMDDAGLGAIGIDRSADDQVSLLGRLAASSGVAGVVCSPLEAAAMRELLGSAAFVVTPGVRPAWAATDDQARVATPLEALSKGASHVVVGRPVTAALDPAVALHRIIEGE